MSVDWIQAITNASQEDLDAIHQLHELIRHELANDPGDWSKLVSALKATSKERSELVAALAETIVDTLMRKHRTNNTPSHSVANIATIEALLELLPNESKSRYQALRLLASWANEKALSLFTKTMIDAPPIEETDVFTVFEPLFTSKDYSPDWLFPRLFEALHQPKIASAIVDLANYVFRNELSETHPFGGRLPEMRKLLEQFNIGLKKLESNPAANQDDPVAIAESVADSSALVVAMCDAFALSHDMNSIEVLQTTRSLSHRRIKVEACAALTKLGDEEAKEELLLLASDASTRMRVLKYAEELHLIDDVDPRYQTDVAIAEARLCMWLAQPRQMGIPPTHCKLIDNRTLFWPGYQDEIECYLFRFTYVLGDREYSNVGITGPMTYAFVGHLAALPVDEIYAAFAGWQADHDEIKQLDIAGLNQHFQVDVDRLKRRLSDRGYDEIEPSLFGRFFGDSVLMANVVQGDEMGQVAISAAVDETWIPHPKSQNPLTSEELYHIFKGKLLLHAFNEKG